MHKLVFYVPQDDAEEVKQAVFAVGAGKLGNYAECCWQTLGQGQFRPLNGANPAIGEVGALEQVIELRVEMLCPDDLLNAALAALKSAHPYEEPAYEAWPVIT
ncbi:NGG1p interacting factor NIF3 [Bacterioplanes sanyensis]|uniref:NGG1p interacting factor NIF3 n=1 Tax=Bacterioplanes sanyensis TaxID=1249553 RepID=A0A222FM30_9GAMM|nr:NGG1p interacting factor NIF3 [Bacterioplanes sanyensis]ASP40077.1 NGG1p interacting factor NIF3 [Bacterioplanes sanyensis]